LDHHTLRFRSFDYKSGDQLTLTCGNRTARGDVCHTRYLERIHATHRINLRLTDILVDISK
jgi:hypothetical protein